MFMPNSVLRPLTNDVIARKAPAVFAGAPKATTSKRYLFVDTADILNGLTDNGWSCVNAVQTMNRSTSDENRLTNKHALYFARTEALGRELQVNGTIPMIKIENSHNGLSTFSLDTGFYRKVCSNGLTIPESIYASPKIKHVKDMKDAVIETTYKVLTDFPKLASLHQNMSGIMLDNDEKFIFSSAVAQVLYTEEERANMQAYARQRGSRWSLDAQLVTPVRYDDRKNDLWTVSNVIQENLIRGNIQLLNDGKLRSQRKVTSIDRDKEIHDVLFKITAHFAKEKGFNLSLTA